MSVIDDKSDIILNSPVSSSRGKLSKTNVSNFLNDSELNSPGQNLSGIKEKDSNFSNKLSGINGYKKPGINNPKLQTPQFKEEKLPSNTTQEDYEAFLQKYKILFEDFKQESKMTSLYFVLDLIKFPVISLIIVIDRYHPLRQSCFISGITFGMLLFLIFLRPLKSNYMFIQYILNQVCVLFCTLSALALAYYDDDHDYDQEKRMKVGWVIVYGNLGLIYFITAIMIGYSMMILYKMAKTGFIYLRKKYRNNEVFPFEENAK